VSNLLVVSIVAENSFEPLPVEGDCQKAMVLVVADLLAPLPMVVPVVLVALIMVKAVAVVVQRLELVVTSFLILKMMLARSL
jgi:hypothetical protein